MKTRTLAFAALTTGILLLTPSAHADNPVIAIDEMEAHLEFVDCGGVIFAEQIPADGWKKMIIIDARDAAQFARGHIPGATMARRHERMDGQGRF